MRRASSLLDGVGQNRQSPRERHHEAIRPSSGGRDVHHPGAGGNARPVRAASARVVPSHCRRRSALRLVQRRDGRGHGRPLLGAVQGESVDGAGGGATPLVPDWTRMRFGRAPRSTSATIAFAAWRRRSDPRTCGSAGRGPTRRTSMTKTTPPPATPPEGFGGVLTRAQWRGVVDFAKATDAALVTSFAISAGHARRVRRVDAGSTRGSCLRTPRRSADASRRRRSSTSLTSRCIGGAPEGLRRGSLRRATSACSCPSSGRRRRAAWSWGQVRWARADCSPTTPGSRARRCSRPRSGGVDVFSYHFVQQRLETLRGRGGIDAPPARRRPRPRCRPDWLARTERDAHYYGALRDRFEPGKPIWLTETRRDRLWRQSLGLDVHRHLPLCRTARACRQPRRPGGHAQHPLGQRLRADRRGHPRTATELLGGAPVATADGHHAARRRPLAGARGGRLRALPGGNARRRRARGRQQRSEQPRAN